MKLVILFFVIVVFLGVGAVGILWVPWAYVVKPSLTRVRFIIIRWAFGCFVLGGRPEWRPGGFWGEFSEFSEFSDFSEFSEVF